MGFMALLATVIPLGLGAAFTPSLLALQVLIVSGDPWARRAMAVALGNALAFGLFGALFLLGFAQARPATGADADLVGILIRAAAGIAMWAFAAWLFVPHPALRDRVESDITAYVRRASSWVFFGIAFLLSIKDVSSFLALLPALHDISVGSVSLPEKAFLLLVLYLLALLPVLLPPALRLGFGHRVDPFFQRVYRFTMDHQFPIVGVMCAIIGTYLVVSAVLIAMGVIS